MKFIATIEIIGFKGTLTFESDAKDEDELRSVLAEQIEQIRMNDCTIAISEPNAGLSLPRGERG